VKAEKKLPKPQAPAPKPELVNVGGRKYSINLITPAPLGLGSQFFPAFQLLPPRTRVSAAFAASIEEHRIDPKHEDEAGEPTISFQLNQSYAIGPDGRRYARRVEQQAVAMMHAAQEDEALREQAAEERRALEESEWYQQRLNDEFALTRAKMQCLSDAHERRLAAQEFLDAEERAQEEQERAADAGSIISKGTP
jgi:hypothetical protein